MAAGTFFVANIRDFVRFNQESGNQAAAELNRQFAALAQKVTQAQDGVVAYSSRPFAHNGLKPYPTKE